MKKAIVLTDEIPFPPSDGKKIPIANYTLELKKRGFDVSILLAKDRDYKGLPKVVLELVARIIPFGPFYAREKLSTSQIDSASDSELLFPQLE